MAAAVAIENIRIHIVEASTVEHPGAEPQRQARHKNAVLGAWFQGCRE
jgi:hypothetical protein